VKHVCDFIEVVQCRNVAYLKPMGHSQMATDEIPLVNKTTALSWSSAGADGITSTPIPTIFLAETAGSSRVMVRDPNIRSQIPDADRVYPPKIPPPACAHGTRLRKGSLPDSQIQLFATQKGAEDFWRQWKLCIVADVWLQCCLSPASHKHNMHWDLLIWISIDQPNNLLIDKAAVRTGD
jgi:hypothetical protein